MKTSSVGRRYPKRSATRGPPRKQVPIQGGGGVATCSDKEQDRKKVLDIIQTKSPGKRNDASVKNSTMSVKSEIGGMKSLQNAGELVKQRHDDKEDKDVIVIKDDVKDDIKSIHEVKVDTNHKEKELAEEDSSVDNNSDSDSSGQDGEDSEDDYSLDDESEDHYYRGQCDGCGNYGMIGNYCSSCEDCGFIYS